MIADSQLSPGDILYMDTKALLVQVLRQSPHLGAGGNISLTQIAEAASTSRDSNIAKKGVKIRNQLRQLESMGVVDARDGYSLMTEEVSQELIHLGNVKEKVTKEISSLQVVYNTICDHNNYLRSQLESYKAYLQNVRIQSGFATKDSDSKKKNTAQGPFKFSHAQLEKDGVIVDSNVPENRQGNIYFNVFSPVPGTFLIALHYKGKEKRKDISLISDLRSHYVSLSFTFFVFNFYSQKSSPIFSLLSLFSLAL